MIDIAKLEGITQAIESESRIPSPSHANLARLLGMFCRELINSYRPQEAPPPPHIYTETVTMELPEMPVVKKKRGRRKSL